MSPDELFAWRVEKMGILEALRLLELEQVEQDRILALEEKEEEAASMMTATAAEFESAFNSSSSMGIIPSTTHVLLNKKDAGDAAPTASAFSEDDHNKVMMDYVFGKNNPLVTRGQSFNVSPPAVQVNTATPATEVKSTNEDPSGLDNNNAVQTDEVQEDNDLDDMLFVKDIPAVDTRKSSIAFVETNVDSDDELEESPKAGIWTLGTLTLAVGVVAVVGYLAFGRGKRRGGARK
ncbi:hypothetical protein BDR26DRAFT_862542 [Obelidium mucronatum]|nr:hypothetical protein BDR26DRAFT_862542 [Obelidium mucronatum]